MKIHQLSFDGVPSPIYFYHVIKTICVCILEVDFLKAEYSWVLLFKKIKSANLYLWSVIFSVFPFNVIIIMTRFKSTILPFDFYLSIYLFFIIFLLCFFSLFN